MRRTASFTLLEAYCEPMIFSKEKRFDGSSQICISCFHNLYRELPITSSAWDVCPHTVEDGLDSEENLF
jgi:hypothetical protein